MSISISANKLAEFIAAKTPEQRRRIVRNAIRAAKTKADYAPYYASFRTPAKEFVATGSVNEINQTIAGLKARKGTRWHDIDARITTEAFKKLVALRPHFDALQVQFTIPPREKVMITFANVAVSITPDLLVTARRNGVPIKGALRFYLAKETAYQLGTRRAELVAGMQYQSLIRASAGGPVPDTHLCMVVECIQGRITKAREDAASELRVIERGCADFEALWHLLEGQEAA